MVTFRGIFKAVRDMVRAGDKRTEYSGSCGNTSVFFRGKSRTLPDIFGEDSRDIHTVLCFI